MTAKGRRRAYEAESAIAADLAEQGYTLQRVETVGEGARWIVVEVGQ